MRKRRNEEGKKGKIKRGEEKEDTRTRGSNLGQVRKKDRKNHQKTQPNIFGTFFSNYRLNAK